MYSDRWCWRYLCSSIYGSDETVVCPYSRVICNEYHYHLGNCILISHPKRGDSIPKLLYTGNQTLFSPLTVTSPLKMEARIGSVRRQTRAGLRQTTHKFAYAYKVTYDYKVAYAYKVAYSYKVTKVRLQSYLRLQSCLRLQSRIRFQSYQRLQSCLRLRSCLGLQSCILPAYKVA